VPIWLKGKMPIKYATDVHPEDVKVDTIEISSDRGIFKNALAVGIPKTKGQKGIAIAAAMGIFCFPETEGQEMALFETLQPEDLEKAKTLAERVSIKLIEGWERSEGIQIRASVRVKHKRLPKGALTGIAKIEKTHSNVTSISAYDSLDQVAEVPSEKKLEIQREDLGVEDRLKGMSISEIVAELEVLPEDVVEKMIELVEMNIAASEEGLRRTKGLGGCLKM